MKEIFPGYSRKSEKEIRGIWENCILIFDANVLLNLYRYSDTTKNTILDLIGKYSDRICLPFQSALEYNRNRYEVIADQERAYKEFIEKITQIQKDLQSTSKPPFLSDLVNNELNIVFEKVSSEVEESIKKYCDYLKQDPIYEKLSELFKGRITESYNFERLEEIFKEGEERYKLKIPPGFEDEKNKDGNRKYGDLVLWKQIIDKAKEQEKPIIFITDERKIDWWWKIRDGRNMGPRQELVEEIYKEAKVDFYMYSSERFLSYGQIFLEEQVNQKALEEIQAMKRAELEDLYELKKLQELEYKKDIQRKEELITFRDKFKELTEQIYALDKYMEGFQNESPENMEVQEYLHTLNIQRAMFEDELNELKQRMDSGILRELETLERNRDFERHQKFYKKYLRNKQSD